MNHPQPSDGSKSTTGILPSKVPINRTPSPPDSKPSPAAHLLTNLRGFNIDKSRYKHYGHQSLMSAQALEEIIHTAKKSPTPESPVSPSDKLTEALGLPKHNYTAETLQEIVRLKIEEEKTKQLAAKQELGTTIVELLRLAKSMNILGDIVHLLFGTSDDPERANDELRAKIESLKQDPQSIDRMVESGSQTPKPVKRKYSEASQPLPSFDETAENIGIPPLQSKLVSPVTRSPDKSPHIAHRRVPSDQSEGRPHPPSQQLSPSLSEPTTAAQHPQLYPIYYTPLPPQNIPNKEGEHKTSSLGSPYSQKYQPVIYQTPQGQYIQQQPVQYYIPSPPSNSSHQPVPHYMVTSAPQPVLVPNYVEHKDDVGSSAKKHKSSKSSNINFMITTPKNPPAKKYNNSNKDRT